MNDVINAFNYAIVGAFWIGTGAITPIPIISWICYVIGVPLACIGIYYLLKDLFKDIINKEENKNGKW
tara:strand:+ start:39 stop:242 length:204 start_codon:yes stop_codon:yes gene_type:complete